MKKIFKWSILAAATLSLAACGATSQKNNSQQSKTEKSAGTQAIRRPSRSQPQRRPIH